MFGARKSYMCRCSHVWNSHFIIEILISQKSCVRQLKVGIDLFLCYFSGKLSSNYLVEHSAFEFLMNLSLRCQWFHPSKLRYFERNLKKKRLYESRFRVRTNESIFSHHLSFAARFTEHHESPVKEQLAAPPSPSPELLHFLSSSIPSLIAPSMVEPVVALVLNSEPS